VCVVLHHGRRDYDVTGGGCGGGRQAAPSIDDDVIGRRPAYVVAVFVT